MKRSVNNIKSMKDIQLISRKIVLLDQKGAGCTTMYRYIGITMLLEEEVAVVVIRIASKKSSQPNPSAPSAMPRYHMARSTGHCITNKHLAVLMAVCQRLNVNNLPMQMVIRGEELVLGTVTRLDVS